MAQAANPVPLGQSAPSGGFRGLRPGPVRAGTLFGIAPGGACRAATVASGAVGSYPTVSPLPCETGRFHFCGAIRRVSPPGRYPAPLLYGVRTFLSGLHPSGHPAFRATCDLDRVVLTVKVFRGLSQSINVAHIICGQWPLPSGGKSVAEGDQQRV